MTISVVQVQIKLVQADRAQLRVFGVGEFLERSVALGEIADLVKRAESGYYTPLQEDFLRLGRRLYAWVDGSERVLSRTIAAERPEVIAISAVEALAHLPWELLADEDGFLVGRGMVPVRWVSAGRDRIESVSAPKSQALKLMLMATDPTDSTSLAYEVEEGRILEATGRSGLELVVEESGCLEELGLLVRDYGVGYFDAFHLTGHATTDGTEPTFGMESQTGDLVNVTAGEIGRSFGALPPVVFLSGCQTGKLGNKGAISSMAEQLVRAGAMAVLGWGETVADPEASLAAEIFYGELAAGARVDRALAKTYEQLMTKPRDYAVRDWHKLRLYVGDRLPGALVVPLRMRKKKAQARLAESEFLDGAGLVKVASRSTFVGRRRVLQRVLRLLQDQESVGVMLHGLGGNGKSSVAARLCDRLASSALGYQRVVMIGAIEEAGFVNAFSQALDREPDCVAILNESGALRSRLVRVLEKTERNWLFVMDDFEALSGGESLNLDEVGGAYVMNPVVAEVMGDLAAALWECGGRVMITSRYEVAGLARVARLPLGPMDDREMLKKRRQLEYVAKIGAAVEPEKSVMQELQDRAEALADGNPRLLMWLDRVLCEVADPREILGALAARAIEFREDVLAEKLLALLGTKERRALMRGLVFEIGVPRAVFESVVEFGDFAQAIALGLLAVSPDGNVRVPRLLGLEVPQDEALAATAAQAIYAVWKQSESEIECLEMHRLAIEGKVGTIAADIGSRLAHHWRHEDGNSWKAATLCRLTLEVSDSYMIWYQLAQSTQSLEAYQTTMGKLPSEDLDEKALRGKAVIIHSAGTFHAAQGRISDAIALYEESLAISKSISDQRGIATATYSIADAYRHQGKVDEALPLYENSLAIQRSIENQQGIAAILKDLGMEHYSRGNVCEGMALLEESLTILQSIGNHVGYYPHLRYGIPAGIEELINGISRERKRRYSSHVDDWDL